MVSIDGSSVNVALPVIQQDLAVSLITILWVVNIYSLGLAALMLIGGTAGDHFGRRRIFIIGIVLFTVASLLCGLSNGAAQLITARGLQGLGGALLVPTNLAIIGAVFDEGERGKAIGTWAGFTAIAGALGPLIGGWLIDTISWRAIFFLNVPVALVTLYITWRHLRESRNREPGGRLDWRGAGLAVATLGALAFGLIESGELGWSHPIVIGTLVAGALLLAAFIRCEARSAAPMVPLSLFRSRMFSAVNILTLLLYAALAGAFFFLPFNLMQVQHYPATWVGAIFLPVPLVIGVLSRWSGGLLDRMGARRPLIVGPLITAAAFLLLARTGAGASLWIDFLPPMVLIGLGMAITIAPLTTAVMNAVDESQTGVASGINNSVEEVATLLAVAVSGAAGIAVFNHALMVHLAGIELSPDVARALPAIGQTLTGGEIPSYVQGHDRALLDAAIVPSFLVSFRLLMLAAAGLAVLGSICAALMIDRKGGLERRA